MNLISFVPRALPTDILSGMNDVHSHILCGVDDGVKDFESSVLALQYLESKGVERVTLTPHFMTGVTNNRASIEEKYNKFKSDCASKTNVKLSLAAEYMIDQQFVSHAADGYLTIGSSKKVLVETSYMMARQDTPNLVYNMMLSGYQTIIAHPERYQYATIDDYQQWTIKGHELQLNLLSLAGAYGPYAYDNAMYLLHHKMYTYVGTDFHNLNRFDSVFGKIKLRSKYIDYLKELIQNNLQLFKFFLLKKIR